LCPYRHAILSIFSLERDAIRGCVFGGFAYQNSNRTIGYEISLSDETEAIGGTFEFDES